MRRSNRDDEDPDPLLSVDRGSDRSASAIFEAHGASGPRQLAILGDAPTATDELGRSGYVQALAKVITDADTPLVIAVYGAWGTGKTSLMIQLQDSLERSGRVKRTVWFDPWTHQSDETPVLGLLHATVRQLNQELQQRVKDALLNIARAMATMEVSVPVIGLRVGRVLDEVANGVYEKRTQQARLRSHFESVLDAAGRKDGRIVFFIDDLDRCSPRTALRLLETLHLFLDFENCIFVLGLDREPIEAAVAAEYRDIGLRAESFLDKIIQLPFTIPPIAGAVIDSFIERRLPAELKACRPVLSAATPDDPRQLKRTINVLLLSHSLVDEDSFSSGYDPCILAVVVLIQNLAPALYRILRIRPTAIHKLIPAGSQDSSQNTASSGNQTDASDLWARYIEPTPGLAQAMRLVPISPDLDIDPYLKLTSVSGPGDSVRITSFGPASGPAGTRVTLTGSGFRGIGGDAGDPDVTVGGLFAPVQGTATDTTLTITVPQELPPGGHDFQVITADGRVGTGGTLWFTVT
jgi:KAP family P-loop domain/IPT/TIG domain